MDEPIQSYQDLIAWQKAFRLGVIVHELAGTLPENERFGLIAQLRRAAIEAASSIARGYGAGNTRDYVWFLKSARGELYKLDTQLLFALEFKYVTQERYDAVKPALDESERVLAGLIRSLGG
ncbi:MAG: four helix bundle protein [Phycisphaerales bacterium JB039]